MPSTPTTKSQVQAYRFVLRRMQSALVRKDAVMLHDPMRTHTRATIVGVCIAAIGMVGFLIWGLLSPKPTPPAEDGIIIGKPSGWVYVLINKPDRRLIPTFNLASARLLLLAQQTQGQQGQDSGTAAQIPDGSTGGAGPKEPEFIDDNELKDIPRDRLTGIQNGPQLLPGDGERITPNWAVCDAFQYDPSLPSSAQKNQVETTVLAGEAALGAELAEAEALLVQAPDKKVHLVYRTPVTANIRNANAVRAEVDINNPNLAAALNLNTEDIRPITTGLLNAIPAAPTLAAPPIPGRDGESRFDIPNQDGDGNLKVGAVFQTERAGQVEDIYVLHTDGKERIKKSTADLIRYEKNSGGERIDTVSPDAIARLPIVDRIIDTDSPAAVPEVLKVDRFPVACLGWSVVGEGQSADIHTAVHVGPQVPLPKKADGTPYKPVKISSPSSSGQKIDHFFMRPGHAAVVRQSASKADFAIGSIMLVSDRGVKFGVRDDRTAAALGLSNQRPAPKDILNLLPDGASLNTTDVLQTYDTVPVQEGTFETDNPASGGGG